MTRRRHVLTRCFRWALWCCCLWCCCLWRCCLWCCCSVGLVACEKRAAPDPVASGESTGVKSAPSAHGPEPFEPARVEYNGSAMGTHIAVIAYTTRALGEQRIKAAINAAMAEIQRLEALMSDWKPDSEVSRLNRNPGQLVALSPETFEVIEKSLWASQVSRGTFDITFQTLSGLWKFGDAQDTVPAPPSASEVARLRPRVGYRQIRVNADTRQVAIGARQQVGLGGIAKGYIVDKAAGVLTQAGIRSFLLRAGGDLYGAGTKPGGEPWIAGIQDPRGKQEDYFATLELNNHAFSTAGDYARAYVHQGKRYHHIIDPRTGYPASASKSVTIWAESALLADVIDDSVFILGPQQGLELVESVAGVGAVIVDTHDKVWVSKRLAGKVLMLHEPTPGD